jgi:hypothetical protein
MSFLDNQVLPTCIGSEMKTIFLRDPHVQHFQFGGSSFY